MLLPDTSFHTKFSLQLKELDSYIKAKLDESLAKDLNIKLQHMKKLIDRVLQEKERLEKAHKNAIIKIQVRCMLFEVLNKIILLIVSTLRHRVALLSRIPHLGYLL